MAGEINYGLLDTKAPERVANSFFEGQQQQQQNALSAAQLQSAQRQNRLADLAMQDDEARRQAYASSGGDFDKTMLALRQSGQYEAAQKLQAQQLDAQTKQASLGKTAVDTKAATLKLSEDQQHAAVSKILMYNSADEARAALAAGMQRGEVTPEHGNAILSSLPQSQDPSEFKAWQTGMVRKVLTPQQQVTADHQDATLAETVANNKRVDVRANQGLVIQRGNLAERHAENAAPPAASGFSPEDLRTLAEQYRAGDTSIFTNLGRGAQGAANIIALRKEIAKQTRDAGETGADVAAKNAEYFGTKAGQRAVGTRTANVELATNEASQLLPLAREASADVARSGLLPFGKAQIMFDNQTNDPKLRQFAAANNSLINVYARAISPSGVPTVADKEHAREMLATAMDDRSYNAVLDQMQKEMDAARKSPGMTRRTFSNAVTGRTETPPVQTGGMPADIAALLQKHGGR